MGVLVGVVALAAGVVGVGVGLLWRVVAPRVPIIKIEQGFVYADAQPEQAVAADGWFGGLGLAAGVLAAVAVWYLLRHRRGTVVMVSLVLGSLAGAWLGWWLGIRLEMEAFEALAASTPIGGRLDAPLSLGVTDLDREHLWPPKITGVIVAQALGAAVAYTTLAGFATDPELRANPPRPEDVGDAYPEPIWPPLAPPPTDPWGQPGPQASPAVLDGPAPQASPDVLDGPAPQASPDVGLSSGRGEPSDPKDSPAPP